MQKIDIHNYEAYLLDLSEGNLTDELQMELELFLIQHPELNIDLADLSFASLNEEAITFSNKHHLKRSETDLVSEAQFIAYIEDQLSPDERTAIEKSCALNPALSKELALYNHTIAVADTSVVYINKNELKRKPKVIWFNFSATQYAAAACVVFLIGLFMLWPKTENPVTHSSLANKTTNDYSSASNHDVNFVKENNGSIAAIKEPGTSLKQSVPLKATRSLLANTAITKQHQTVISKDTTAASVASNNKPVIENNNHETLLAQNSAPVVKQSPQTIVQVITESEDDALPVSSDKKKKGIWAAASRALKNLNHVGVKSVNGDEEDSKEKTSYALTLGGMSITHKAGNL